MELATALIWTLRIVLPIVLFCIYFKLQSPKENQDSWSGPTEHQHPRSRLLAARKAVTPSPAPEELSNIVLVTPERAPHLFAGGRERREPREGRERGGRDRGKGKGKGKDGDERERRERPRDQPSGNDKAESTGGGSMSQSGTAEAVAETAEAAGPEDVGVGEASPGDERAHLESLLNYVAFARKEQRTFILDEETVPPPPPPGKKPAAEAKPSVSAKASTEPSEETDKANTEAQMVLNGAIKLKRGAEVAKNLHEQLVAGQVEISERTYALMIEACVVAHDLKSSSDFLMKMEASGHCPDTELLDRVMDLYSQQKSAREHEKTGSEAPRSEAAALATVSRLRTNLSSGASLFVPLAASVGCGAMQPPPPPLHLKPPPPPEHLKPKKAPAAPAATVSNEETSPAEGQRTSLKATAKAFQPVPSFQPQGLGAFDAFDPGYDAYPYAWMGGEEAWAEEDDGWKGKGSGKAKGKGNSDSKASATGKGKGETKSKGEAKGKESAGDKQKGEQKKVSAGKKEQKWQPKM